MIPLFPVSIWGGMQKKLTLINCTVESLQSMCYIENLLMKNCKLLNTTLAWRADCA